MAMLISAPAGLTDTDMISEPTAMLQGLDKITARVSKFEAPVGKAVQFGSSVDHACAIARRTRPRTGPRAPRFCRSTRCARARTHAPVFSGWMFSSSPALSALEHPVYDVILLECKGGERVAAPGASGSASGNDAR